MTSRPFHRYVAIGDSSTEGIDDPDGRGGYRGWADRLARHLAREQGDLLYANLAIRGRRTRRIREEQLAPALAMRPDLVTFFSGTNDVVARRFDLDELTTDVEHVQRSLIDSGATLLTFTLPDLRPVMPVARLIGHRIEAFNAALREISAGTGALLLDLTEHPVTSDARFWSTDRLHANSAGHARMAAALAWRLGLPGSDPSWSDPLPAKPPPSPVARALEEAGWLWSYLLPWLGRRLVGRSSGDRVRAKRPALSPVGAAQRPEDPPDTLRG